MTYLIDKDNSYFAKINNHTISDYKKCLDTYFAGVIQEVDLASKTPIFLDTNVLLRYYSISFTARAKLFEFIKNNKDRIYLTYQVQVEYLKNREDLISRFFDEVIPKITNDFNSELINKTNAFSNKHKVVLKDYPFMEAGLNSNIEALKKLDKELNESVKKKQEETQDLLFNDELLALLNECKSLQPLQESELTTIKNDYIFLSKNITQEKLSSFKNKPNATFPGLGDLFKKPDNPYGDFIIYHEIMKFMKSNSSDAVFLTFDTSKSDWIKEDGKPYLHYVQNMYANTDQMLYILDADRTLAEILDVSIESLLSTSESTVYTEKTSLVKFVDFVSVPWILNHWRSRVCFREGRNLLFKGDALQKDLETDGSHCNIKGILEVGKLYKIECKTIARGQNPTGKLSLWCHDDIGDPSVSKGMSDETGYTLISPSGTTLTLFFAASYNSNLRIHLQYMPGKNETGEILVFEGVSISIVE